MTEKQTKEIESNILKLDNVLKKKYTSKLEVNFDLKRTLVSFQANKIESGYRWYKFKEGFSSSLVKYCLKKAGLKKGKILDPFAGSGTSLFVGVEEGLDATGIELLPIGREIIKAREFALQTDKEKLRSIIADWIKNKPWKDPKIKAKHLKYLNITKDAFPDETEVELGRYLTYCEKLKDKDLSQFFRFAALCILEEISYTRKDGQYLRWDHRSRRTNGSKIFNKGLIKTFDQAISSKLDQICIDLNKEEIDLFSKVGNKEIGSIELLEGSCLDVLPKLKAKSYDFVMTSPPYCNRYDYTRTYALELALLEVEEQELKDLRQTMLSCTVENREKSDLKNKFSREVFEEASKAFDSQKLLKSILDYLEILKKEKKLNNTGIVRMIRNYFYETSLVIFECSRILKSGGYFFMVNDNVRYASINIPVDLISSEFAKAAGFNVEKIWVLPIGKGNSSQQMGLHGREELRKCVYVWRKI